MRGVVVRASFSNGAAFFCVPSCERTKEEEGRRGRTSLVRGLNRISFLPDTSATKASSISLHPCNYLRKTRIWQSILDAHRESSNNPAA